MAFAAQDPDDGPTDQELADLTDSTLTELQQAHDDAQDDYDQDK